MVITFPLHAPIQSYRLFTSLNTETKIIIGELDPESY